jgi:hypothetical protein
MRAMALSLDIHVGDKFHLHAMPVTVRSLAGYYAATVEVNGRTFEITEESPVEICPGVKVRCALPQSGKVEKYRAAHRLIIDAPLSIRASIVLRRKAQSARASLCAKLSHSRQAMRAHGAFPRFSSIRWA